MTADHRTRYWAAEIAICVASSKALIVQSRAHCRLSNGCPTESLNIQAMVFVTVALSSWWREARNNPIAAALKVITADFAVPQKKGKVKNCRAGTMPAKSPAAVS